MKKESKKYNWKKKDEELKGEKYFVSRAISFALK